MKLSIVPLPPLPSVDLQTISYPPQTHRCVCEDEVAARPSWFLINCQEIAVKFRATTPVKNTPDKKKRMGLKRRANFNVERACRTMNDERKAEKGRGENFVISLVIISEFCLWRSMCTAKRGERAIPERQWFVRSRRRRPFHYLDRFANSSYTLRKLTIS